MLNTSQTFRKYFCPPLGELCIGANALLVYYILSLTLIVGAHESFLSSQGLQWNFYAQCLSLFPPCVSQIKSRFSQCSKAFLHSARPLKINPSYLFAKRLLDKSHHSTGSRGLILNYFSKSIVIFRHLRFHEMFFNFRVEISLKYKCVEI